MSDGMKTWVSQSHEERGRIFLPLPFCFIRAVSGLDSANSTLRRMDGFTQPIESNVNLPSVKTPSRTHMENVLCRQPLIQST